ADDMHDEADREAIAMAQGAVRLQKVSITAGTVELPPRAATGMAVGPQVVQRQPAAIVTIGVGTNRPRGVHRLWTSVRWGHGIGRQRRRGGGRYGHSPTQSRVRLVREARKQFGLGAAWALGLRGHGWGGGGWLGLRELQHKEEPCGWPPSQFGLKKYLYHHPTPTHTHSLLMHFTPYC